MTIQSCALSRSAPAADATQDVLIARIR